MLGLSDDKNAEKIKAENAKSGDILIGNFIDTYYNLTVKSLSALDWSVESCPETKSIILCDDDVQFRDVGAMRKFSGKFFWLFSNQNRNFRNVFCHSGLSGRHEALKCSRT